MSEQITDAHKQFKEYLVIEGISRDDIINEEIEEEHKNRKDKTERCVEGVSIQ